MGFKSKTKEARYKNKWYLENKERLLQKAKGYRKNNLEKIHAYDKERGFLRNATPEEREVNKQRLINFRIEREKRRIYKLEHPIIPRKRVTKEETRARQHKWDVENREKINEKWRKRYANDPKFRLSVRLKTNEYRLKNKEKINAWFRNYNQNEGREISKTIQLNRRARKISSTDGSVTTEFRIELLKSQNNLCNNPYCKIFIDKNNMELDHIISLKKHGTHTRDNVQYLCGNCNRKKNMKSWEDFLLEFERELTFRINSSSTPLIRINS